MSKKKVVLWVVGVPFVVIVILGTLFLYNNRPPNIYVPTPKLPSPNAWDDFARACKMLKTQQFPGPLSDIKKRPAQWTAQDYHAFLAANSPAIAAWRKALFRPYQVPPVRCDADYARVCESCSRFRELARAATGEGMYYERIGQLGRAIDCYLDVMEFGVTVPRGGDTTMAFTGGGTEEIGGARAQRTIFKLDKTQLVRVASRLDRIKAKRVPYSDIVTEQGYQNAAILNECFSGRRRWENLRDAETFIQFDEIQPPARSRVAKFVCSNKSRMIRKSLSFFKAVAAEQRGYYTGRSNVPVFETELAFMLCPSGLALRYRRPYVVGETRVELMRAEVAIRRYRFDHGHFPLNLSGLTPNYLKAVPIDPFGRGKPLLYRQLKSGADYLLYGIGPDMKDDGGKAGTWQRSTNGDLLLGHAP